MRGMNELNEMIKRRKDDGFTLIELMIVIAVIGILAVVLIPKVGTIKTQAKSAGIDTNIHMVQAYVQSRVSSWANANSAAGTVQATVRADITSALSGGTDLMQNPFSGSTSVVNANALTGTRNVAFITDNTGYAAAGYTDPNLAGTIVIIPDAPSVTPSTGIFIYAFDSAGRLMADKTVRITP